MEIAAMMRLAKQFWINESGATAIEYGLIASMIFLAIVGGVRGTAGKTTNMFNTIQNNV